MASLDSALEKLERAIGRLETVQSAAATLTDADEVVVAVEAAQRENVALIGQREAVAERLDQVIDRLSQVLNEDGA